MGRRASGEDVSDLLLGAQVVGLATLLVAVDSTGVQVSITLATDHFVTVVLLGKLAEGRLDDTTLQVKHQVYGGFFLDIIV